MPPLQIEPLLAAAVVRRLLLVSLQCPLMAQSRHAQCADKCPLLGAKRTLTNRCLPISIYEFTA